MSIDYARLSAGLLPIHAPPCGPGWNRDMIEGIRPAGDPVAAAVMLALRDAQAGPEMLFTLRHDELTRHAGQVSFPGGRADPGDASMLEAALRETEEEIGLARSALEPLGYLDCLDTVSGYRVTPVVARVLGDPPLRLQPAEVSELFSVPLAYLLDPANMGQRTVSTPIGPRQVSEIRHAGHVIWGATALMIVNLQQRMGLR